MRTLILLSLFASAALAQFNGNPYEGYLDRANCQYLGGWVQDDHHLSDTITVGLYDGNVWLASADATAANSHRFWLTTPAQLKDGYGHQINARVAATNDLIPGSPRALSCGTAAPYFTDVFSSINTTNWYQNGTVAGGYGGLTGNGSLISKVAAPDGTSEYEVRMGVTAAQAGGVYISYLQASNDAQSGPSATGSYYAVELQNPSGGVATVAVYKRVDGVVTQLASTVVYYTGPFVEVRSVRRGSALSVYVADIAYIGLADTSLSAGKPGVGIRGAPASNAVTEVNLVSIDRVPPGAMSAQAVVASAFPNSVELRWQPPTDQGTGVYYYHMYRDGVFLSFPKYSEFVDRSATPDTTYTYFWAAFDYHGNQGPGVSFTVRTPPAGAIDPRQVGVRPLGSYWGAAGENIDTRSGNVNFTIPILRAAGRQGLGFSFALSHN